MDIERVAIIGCGTIGFSFAHVFARAGLRVAVYDSDALNLSAFEDRLRKSAADPQAWGLGADRDAVATAVAAIAPFDDLDGALDGVGYVQECVFENLEVKQEVFRDLDARTGPAVILASSASMFGMSDIAAKVARHPERCVVAHPTNPPHLLSLTEVVPGKDTAPEAVERTRAFLRRSGQDPIVCRKEIFGFVLNRLQFALTREAFYLAREGVASIGDIDKAVSEGLGPRWAFIGPFSVEATNSAGIEAALSGYNVNTIGQLMADVGRPFDGLDEHDIALVTEGFHDEHNAVDHETLARYRDRMVHQLRQIKRGAPVPSGHVG